MKRKSNILTIMKKELARFFGDRRMVASIFLPGLLIYLIYTFMGDALMSGFGVDEDICTGDHACIRLSGCPSLSLKRLDDPLRDDPVASIDHTCVGCGNCGEVADAAVLCPSFYEARVVHNPSALEKRMHRWRQAIIHWLQTRRDRKRLSFDAIQGMPAE